MSSKSRLGLYVSDKCERAAPNGKPWLEFRAFVRKYWPLLSNYTLLVSEKTQKILEEISADLQRSTGVAPQWKLEVSRNPTALRFALHGMSEKELERILFFLDPENLKDEWEKLFMLRLAIAQRGQKLNINCGAWLWAEKEWAENCGVQCKSEIHSDDAIVFLGQDPSWMLDRFVLEHLETVMLFNHRILTSRVRPAFGEYLKIAEPRHLLKGTSNAGPKVASFLLADYFYGTFPQRQDKLCHVVYCAGRQRERAYGSELESLIETCADPRMRINLMINWETAEEWIQQEFQVRAPGSIALH
ncbi:MAG TPA: hypothetical protein VF532_21310 [Candidatus Angelobacter sp.]